MEFTATFNITPEAQEALKRLMEQSTREIRIGQEPKIRLERLESCSWEEYNEVCDLLAKTLAGYEFRKD